MTSSASLSKREFSLSFARQQPERNRRAGVSAPACAPLMLPGFDLLLKEKQNLFHQPANALSREWF
jgi:hypothetical protein